MREIVDILREFERREGETLALATLVRVVGSSYRRPGARMLISADGSTVGSLSAGCLEDEVVEKAREVLRTGAPASMTFDTRRRFGCNGSLEILVERVSPAFLQALAGHVHARRPCRVATGVCGSRLVEGGWEPGDGELVQSVEPQIQLVVVGNGPDSVALHGFAEALGWKVCAFDDAVQLAPFYDARTAAVVKTHNYGRDFAALRLLLPMNLRYVGLIGPRARREQLLSDLLDTGVFAAPGLHAPAGLDLGGDSPESVALAIVAEIQTVFAGGTGEALRNRRTPIYSSRPKAVPV